MVGIGSKVTGCEDAPRPERALRMAIVALIGGATTLDTAGLHITLGMWAVSTFFFPLATGMIPGADDSSAAIGMHVSKPCTSDTGGRAMPLPPVSAADPPGERAGSADQS